MSSKNLVKEIVQLRQQQDLEGIKVFINEEDMTDLSANIDGPAGTPYDGGCFKIKVKVTEEYPNVPPKCHFVTKIFHPNVSSSGEICVNTLKKEWRKEYGLKHVLLTIKCLLIAPNPESALNEEAGKLILEDYEKYAQRARLLTSIHAYQASSTPLSSSNPKSIAVNNSRTGSTDKDPNDQSENTSCNRAESSSPVKRPVACLSGVSEAKKKPHLAKKSLKRL